MDEASYPESLRYHPGHGWVRIEGHEAVLGITWYAQDQLGEVVFFDAPATGAELVAGEPYAQLESVKATSDVIAPVSGEVTEVNGALEAAPEAINDDPYGEGWLVKVRLGAPGAADALLEGPAYEAGLG